MKYDPEKEASQFLTKEGPVSRSISHVGVYELWTWRDGTWKLDKVK